MQCLHYAKTIGLVTNNLKNDKQLQIIYPFPIILFPLMLQCYVYQTRHSPLLEVFFVNFPRMVFLSNRKTLYKTNIIPF